MKDEWINRYRRAADKQRNTSDVLIGFNANIDQIVDVAEIDLDESPAVHIDQVKDMKDMKSELNYAINNELSEEVELEFDPELEDAENRIGGQAGIMSNFLSRQGDGVIFYTPFLSEELSEQLDEKILYPTVDGGFVLKNVKDASNSDRTKKNIVVELEDSHRVIFSRKLRGFGPYFRKEVENNLEDLENGVDKAILSGFHDVTGNIESKMKKAAEQMKKFEIPVHVEYVQRKETDEAVIEHIFPEAVSVGLDETEMHKVAKLMDTETDEGSLGEAFNVAKTLIHQKKISRVHIHTMRYHVTVTDQEYDKSQEQIRDAMLYGELAGILGAETGDMPTPENFSEFDMENKHLHRLDELEHFEDFFDLEGFAETGIGEVKGLNVVAIPTLIHEAPAHVVGLGDIISSGAFTAER